MDWHGTEEIKELKAEIAILRDQLGEALVRENNLLAALEEIVKTECGHETETRTGAIARKALANEEGK